MTVYDSGDHADSRVTECVAPPLPFAPSPVHQPKRWLTGPCPPPRGNECLSVSVRYAFASATAFGIGWPRDSPAAMADERVHPVPWVFVVGIWSSVKMVNETPSYRTSLIFPFIPGLNPSPAKCPPFDQDRAWTHRMNQHRRIFHIGQILNCVPGQDRRFFQIWSYKRG